MIRVGYISETSRWICRVASSFHFKDMMGVDTSNDHWFKFINSVVLETRPREAKPLFCRTTKLVLQADYETSI